MQAKSGAVVREGWYRGAQVEGVAVGMIGGGVVADVTIRNLSEEAHRALRLRAALHGRSTASEMRAILEEATPSWERV